MQVTFSAFEGTAGGKLGVDPWVIVVTTGLMVLCGVAFFVIRHLRRRPRQDAPPPSSTPR